MIRSFSRRMWAAVAFIESGREQFRQLDEAFENYDGHAMHAALIALSATRPKLAANLRKYLAPPTMFPEVMALIGKPMAAIREAAKRMRGEA